jgi:osmotically inducible protein OsmC
MTGRTSQAQWKGSLKQGQGTMKLGSGAFEGAYSFPSRFENGKGTNPEELIGAVPEAKTPPPQQAANSPSPVASG